MAACQSRHLAFFWQGGWQGCPWRGGGFGVPMPQGAHRPSLALGCRNFADLGTFCSGARRSQFSSVARPFVASFVRRDCLTIHNPNVAVMPGLALPIDRKPPSSGKPARRVRHPLKTRQKSMAEPGFLLPCLIAHTKWYPLVKHNLERLTREGANHVVHTSSGVTTPMVAPISEPLNRLTLS